MNAMIKTALRRALWVCCALSLGMLAACASRGAGSSSPPGTIDVNISGVGHLGRMVGIPQFSVNGHWGGNVGGWGGGGSGVCCVNLPVNSQTTIVLVKWESCDISHIEFINGHAVDPDAQCKSSWHEASAAVHFAVPAGDGSGLKIHFLPGNRIEAWYTKMGPASTVYPGPQYPRGPAPDYAKDE